MFGTALLAFSGASAITSAHCWDVRPLLSGWALYHSLLATMAAVNRNTFIGDPKVGFRLSEQYHPYALG